MEEIKQFIEEKIKETKQRNFLFGLSIGVAVMSTVGFVIIVTYMVTVGGTVAKVPAGEDGAGITKFTECLESNKYTSKVQADMSQGSVLGVQGTPATFVNGYLVSGALPYSMFSQIIDDVLAGNEPTLPTSDGEEAPLTKVNMPSISSDDHVTGNENAPITLVQYSDFECPYCSRGNATVQQILTNYGDKVKLVYRHFPLSFHQYSQIAAEASECAAEQGKFWELHDEMFKLNQAQSLTTDNIKKKAELIGLE